MNRKRIGIYFALAFLVWAWAVWHPVHSRSIQLVLAISFAAMAVGSLLLLPKQARKGALFGGAILIAAFGFSLAFAKRDHDEKALRMQFLSDLEAQRGRTYVWGGEGFAGVDCSGLPRRAFRFACLKRGALERNPYLWRLALESWLFDASASAMKEGYRGATTPLSLSAKAITSLDHQSIEPGDLAVTSNGVHLLAYLGDGRWIQADPGALEVIVEDAANSTNAWMNTPVEIVRWSALEEAP